MACVINNGASQAEMAAYRAYVVWLKEAQKIRQMFSAADLSMPLSLAVLFGEFKSRRPKKRKRITK